MQEAAKFHEAEYDLEIMQNNLQSNNTHSNNI